MAGRELAGDKGAERRAAEVDLPAAAPLEGNARPGNFAGAGGSSVVNSLMIKRAIPALLGLLCVCSPLLAQQIDPLSTTGDEIFSGDRLRMTGEVETAPALALYRPDLFRAVDGSLLIHGLPTLTLLDGRRFPISGHLGGTGMAPLDPIPLAFLQAVRVQTVPSPLAGSDGPGGVVDLRLNRPVAGGELGVFYGNAGGKYGREDFQAYIFGGVGNDKFQISAGAAYQNSSGRALQLSY